jgi:hypothetical protein
MPMTLMHTAGLNAVTVDVDTGPYLRATGLSQRQIDELGRLYADR